MTTPSPKTLFLQSLSDETDPQKLLTKNIAEEIFKFFKHCKLFRWDDANNDCEDRANAICLLLDEWNIPNYKGWIASGYFIKKLNGRLTNGWNYHVAALLPVLEGTKIVFYIIDPATSAKLIAIGDWAFKLTEEAYSYYFIKSSDYYIFPSCRIEKEKWHKRNKRNYRWTMQGLSGINGVSVIGKAQLSFNKRRVEITEQSFKKLKSRNPFIQNSE